MPQYRTLASLAEIAGEQWGLVTRRQAESSGISSATFDRLVADGSLLERVAHGVYRLAGAPLPDHLDLRAAWLQLAPEVPAWKRTPDQGVVSHRSAASLYGIGHLPADRHEFTLAGRKQSRRSDVRVHHRPVSGSEWADLRGLPATRPSRTASDLLTDREDPEAVAHLVMDALRAGYDDPGTITQALRPHAVKFGLRRDDGLALMDWLRGLTGDPDASAWIEKARAVPEHDSTASRG